MHGCTMEGECNSEEGAIQVDCEFVGCGVNFRSLHRSGVNTDRSPHQSSNGRDMEVPILGQFVRVRSGDINRPDPPGDLPSLSRECHNARLSTFKHSNLTQTNYLGIGTVIQLSCSQTAAACRTIYTSV